MLELYVKCPARFHKTYNTLSTARCFQYFATYFVRVVLYDIRHWIKYIDCTDVLVLMVCILILMEYLQFVRLDVFIFMTYLFSYMNVFAGLYYLLLVGLYEMLIVVLDAYCLLGCVTGTGFVFVLVFTVCHVVYRVVACCLYVVFYDIWFIRV